MKFNCLKVKLSFEREKKMKKLGFTFIEIFTALIVIMIISGLCVSSFKSRANNQKLKLFAYASINNLMKGNISAMDNNSGSIEAENVDNKDWLCLQIVDAFALRGSANCDVKTAGDTTVNFVMANGVSVQGLSTPWVTIADFDKFKYKDIVIDIDGVDKGVNKQYVDKIPLRIFLGSEYAGIVQPINCGTYDNVYNNTALTSPYCTSGKNADYLSDDSIISYDVYRQINKDSTDASMVAAAQPALKADCMAYGDEGIYSKTACNTKAFNIHHKCLTKDNCKLCATYPNLCKKEDGTAIASQEACLTEATKYNPDDLQCFTLIHRPNAALGIVLDTIVGKEIY